MSIIINIKATRYTQFRILKAKGYILATKVIFSLKKLLITIGRIQTTVFMGLVYYLIIGPMAVVYQALRKKRQAGSSYWIEREKIEDWEKYLKRQF